MAIKVIIGQINDGTISQKYVLSSSMLREALARMFQNFVVYYSVN